jgi:hypothetical protein
MEKINEICGVIDAQGFTVNGEFYIREISVVSDFLKQTELCNTNLKYPDMSKKDRKNNLYVANNILGLSLGNQKDDLPRGIEHGNHKVLIMYEKIRTPNRPYVAVKNDQIIEELEKWGIPYMNIGDYGCPKIEDLVKVFKPKPCHFHERSIPDRRKFRCAEQKCQLIWKWITDMKKIGNKFTKI